ncbi:aminotransferase [Zafaria sp. J156]|uniref:aminotransferase n=1 Tax=Zafaria sp. J156 TaxID=3116490 RepID=UPI002E7736ED|nr:aminotransferase [Zafaria sp. J156]MEE1621062.1 aminotransferase [Zafaria sp. J156]
MPAPRRLAVEETGTASTPGRGLRRPEADPRDAEALAHALFGLDGTARELGGNQDRNFLVDGADGSRGVLKLDNTAFSARELEAQLEGIAHVNAARPGLAAAARPGLDGVMLQRVELQDGPTQHVRLFEYVEGGTLYAAGHLDDAVLRRLGEAAAGLDGALAGFDHPGLDRELGWDLRRGLEQVQAGLGSIGDARRATAVATAAARAHGLIAPLSLDLPLQPIHGDLTDDNVVDAPGRGLAVLDFGDLHRGWRVAEPAVLCASLLRHRAGDPLAVLAAAEAYHARLPLSEAEARALWPLVVLRTAVLVAAGWEQTALEPGNDYAAERMEHEWAGFLEAVSLPVEAGTAAVLERLGFAQREEDDDGAPGPLARLGGAHVLDVGVESPLLDAGAWTDPDAEDRLASEALTRHPVVVLPYGAPRLTRTPALSRRPASTIPLGLQLYTNEPFPLTAPWDGRALAWDTHSVELRGADGRRLLLTGVVPARWADPDGRVPRGALLATAPTSYPGLGGAVGIQWTAPEAPEDRAEVPFLTTGALAPAWRRLTRDPAVLLGLAPTAAEPSAAAEQRRRDAHASSAQERFFAEPPRFERGWRHHLVDSSGRSYLDLVNNVSVLGHGHPGVAGAAASQLRLLNTNSRFLYKALADYSERLVELAPEGSGLDTVLLVNSGSEAVELALKLARTATGRTGVAALREAYHGWTPGADAVTTSAFDNPHAAGTRPDWVVLADAPHPLHGRVPGGETADDAGARHAADLASRLAEREAAGAPVGAFISEAVLGNAGGVLLPKGYLAAVYDAVRAHGGLCIADEVQLGFGRTGRQWAFEREGVVPDIVALAKPMGNGFPLGGVLTTRAIADSLAAEGWFFSSTGGSPAACRVGLAVLDALREEDLIRNARRTGKRLRAALRNLAEAHPLIGHVHGAGLYLGVELVRADGSPAAEEATWVCERLLGLGVITQPGSERRNVLKVKPPLTFDAEATEFLVDALDAALGEAEERHASLPR